MDNVTNRISEMLKDVDEWNQNHAIICAICRNCQYEWRPYESAVLLPKTEYLICPKCGIEAKYTYLDKKTERQKIRKVMGLKEEDNDDLIKKLGESNKRIEQLEQRMAKLDTTVKELLKVKCRQELE